jgi:hypothetical protein
VILNCYRLARTYGQHPDSFLKSALMTVEEHIGWTDKLFEAGEVQQAAAARRRNG